MRARFAAADQSRSYARQAFEEITLLTFNGSKPSKRSYTRVMTLGFVFIMAAFRHVWMVSGCGDGVAT
jgi:hypothetical protein